MSLTKLIEDKEVSKMLGLLKPSACRSTGGSIQVPPSSNRTSLLGIAFDYLLRFELHRRSPHAVARSWIAEIAPEVIHPSEEIWLDVFAGLEDYVPPEEVHKTVQTILILARTAWTTYLNLQSPSISDQRVLAKHSLLLAKLDLLYRSKRLKRDFELVEEMDIDELVALLAIVPYSQLDINSGLLLNPSFDRASMLVGNADADLVIGEMLIDIKTTQENTINLKTHNQVLGYFFLSRKHRVENPSFPEIKQVGIYFSRYGYLWSMSTEQWTTNPKFQEVEQFFFKEAARVYPTSKMLS